jgi:succinate dehydrogenase / fumarate reductase, membrane anchor subunit
MTLRSPLARVLGHGSAKEGVHHWWVQRLTSIALVPLTVWLVVALLSLPLHDRASVAAWIANGWTPLLLSVFVLVATWHSRLGVQVVVEDYVPSAGIKTVSLILSTFVHFLAAAVSIFAVLKIAFE